MRGKRVSEKFYIENSLNRVSYVMGTVPKIWLKVIKMVVMSFWFERGDDWLTKLHLQIDISKNIEMNWISDSGIWKFNGLLGNIKKRIVTMSLDFRTALRKSVPINIWYLHNDFAGRLTERLQFFGNLNSFETVV